MRLREIIFVDDGSTDDTAKIVAGFPDVTYLTGRGKGAGAARNTGWRAARYPLVWFVDADCVAEPDALDLLLPELDDPAVGAVSGSYGITNSESLLASLIHEEIIERHRAMGRRVNFLATFNVVYRRRILERLNGFDERFLKGQDAELSFRVLAAGYQLGFVFDSRVKHYHPDRWLSYLRTQCEQGYWRVWLHLTHKGHAAGDSYSNWVDHVQPPLAVLALASLPLLSFGPLAWISAGPVALLLAAQIPMTVRLILRLRRPRYLCYAAMSFVRAFWRGIGMTRGVLGYLLSGSKRSGVERG
jgi:cellulose synthase/poly-beta-1,6-N-acetylglucosamine synthase-like glycosyltransferase